MLLGACSYLPGALTDKHIDQYVLAYEKLAQVSPQIESERKKSGALSIFICDACRALMTKAVTEAGYSGLDAFLLMDLRISYTMNYVIYLRLAELVGGVASDVPIEAICTEEQFKEKIEKDKESEYTKYCRRAHGFVGYIERVGGMLKMVATTLMSKGDLEIVGKNYEKIYAAVTNQELIDELNHSGGGWDD
jgi:hypothetical protein